MPRHLQNLKRNLAGMLPLALIIAMTYQVSARPMTFALPEADDKLEATIPDGTELTVVTTDEISSKTATEGDPLTFKVEEDVKVNGIVVIAKDTIVKGVVSNAEKSGRMGRSGKLGIRVESTTAIDGQKIRLRASKGQKGGR